MQDLFGNGFLFALSDATWAAKRKATAHAFYKDRLAQMFEILKDKLCEAIHRWQQQMTEGTTEIDIAQEFELIFAKNIIHITFGEDINDQELEMHIRADLEGKKPFEWRSVKMHVAI